jgi:peroxiredoxin
VFCREHAAQLRGIYDEITASGAEVVAIGTGNAMYANAFVTDEEIPFPVLLDEDGEAAKVASVKGGAGALFKLASPSVLKAGARARKAGHHQGKTGTRPLQLGATFVVGPGDQIVYEHLDSDVGDHAPLSDVLAALKA